MNTQSLKNLISDFLDSKANKETASYIIEIIDSDIANNAFQNIWFDSNYELDQEIKDDIWLDINSNLNNYFDYSHKKSQWFKTSWSKIAAVAAIIILACTAGYMISSKIHSPSKNLAKNDFTASVNKGEKAHLTLIDGTKVWLNSGSTLSCKSDFNDKIREVALTGEAYFDVANDKDKRFIVHAGDIKVIALGTRFNIKAYTEDRTVTTTLEQGEVIVNNSKNSLTLKPNQEAIYDAKSKKLSGRNITDIATATFWKEDKLIFNQTSLESIAQTIERIYGVEVEIKDNALNDIQFTGTIRNTSLKNVFKVISESYPIYYKFSGDTIVLTSRIK